MVAPASHRPLNATRMNALIDTAQIASILGMSREHVTDRITKRPDFPAPALNLSQLARRWRETDVRAWAGLDRPSREAISEADVR